MKNISDDLEKPSWPWLISSFDPNCVKSLLQYNDLKMVLLFFLLYILIIVFIFELVIKF
jgi:hypothetical protein